MKKLYTTLSMAAAIIFSGAVFAQGNPQQAPGVSISPANAGPGDEITMTIDLTAICNPSNKDSLIGKTSAGFHTGYISSADSGAWNSVISWDDASALAFTDGGNNTLTITFTPATYYGVAAADMIGFSFVLNGGVDYSGWDTEGKAFNSAGECSDFFVYLPFTPDPVGVSAKAVRSSLSIFPNPASTKFTVDFGTSLANATTLNVINAIGQVVHTQNVGVAANQAVVSTEGFASGLYFVSVEVEGQSIVKKIQVK